MFVELESTDRGKFTVNANHIVTMWEDQDDGVFRFTILQLDGAEHGGRMMEMVVRERISEIVKRVNDLRYRGGAG